MMTPTSNATDWTYALELPQRFRPTRRVVVKKKDGNGWQVLELTRLNPNLNWDPSVIEASRGSLRSSDEAHWLHALAEGRDRPLPSALQRAYTHILKENLRAVITGPQRETGEPPRLNGFVTLEFRGAASQQRSKTKYLFEDLRIRDCRWTRL